MASAMASVRRAISRVQQLDHPAVELDDALAGVFRQGERVDDRARAFSISAAVGAKTSLQMSIWLGMDQRLAVQAHVAALLALRRGTRRGP